MKRRKFITVVGGMAATWPFAGHAQQSTKLHQIGVLSLGRGDKSEKIPETQHQIPPVDLGAELRPGKRCRAEKSNQEPAVSCEILYGCAAKVVELRQH